MSADSLRSTTLRRAFVGSGATAIALLTVAQTQLGDFGFRPSVKYVLVALIVALVACVTALTTVRSARAATLEEDRQLEAALAGRAQRVIDRDPFDLGVRPEPPGIAYQRRSEDLILDRALAPRDDRDAAMILVVGPAGAGKTRSAYEATARVLPQAMLLTPVDGAAVNTLLAQRNRFKLDTNEQAVLWLDSLDRYIEQLDLDALDELLFWTEGSAEELEKPANGALRLLQPLGRWIAAIWQPKRDSFAIQRQARRRVTIIATIRDKALQDVIERDDNTGQIARRLTARMQIVALPARSGRTSLAAKAPSAAHGASVEPRAFEKRPQPTDGRGLLVGLACVLVALMVGLLVLVEREGWKVPPSLTTQVSDVKNALQACQSSQESPAAGKLHKDSAWVLAISSKDCPGSDAVRYYTVAHGRLIEQLSERPDSDERWEFTCLAPKPSPCLVEVPGLGPVTLGAFRSSTTGRLLPLALYRTEGTIRLYAPFLPPASTSKRQAHRDGAPLTLRLHAGAAYSPEPTAPKSLCRQPAQLCSNPAQFLTVLPRTGAHPLLIVGYVTSGTVISPQRLRMHAFGLEDVNKRLRLDPRECLFYSKGIRLSSKHEITLDGSSANVGPQMRKLWTQAKHEAVIC
jgi:hypothetical protein